MDGPLGVYWVRLENQKMPVPWPACVYHSYDAARRHGHDVSVFYMNKPALEPEDRVVFFFGLDPLHLNKDDSISPKKQLLSAHLTSIHKTPFEGSSTLRSIAKTMGLSRPNLAMAEDDVELEEACRQASDFLRLESDDAAREFFSALMLHSINQVEENASQASEEEAKEDEEHTNENTELSSQKTQPIETASAPASEPTGGLSIHIQDECWKKMQDAGWNTMVLSGQELFKKPGVGFGSMQPGINIFDNLMDACAIFVCEQLQSENADPDLVSMFWTMLEQQGWQTMFLSGSPVYAMPKVSFVTMFPDVNLFKTKLEAISKYFNNNGMLQSKQKAVAKPKPKSKSSSNLFKKPKEHERKEPTYHPRARSTNKRTTNVPHRYDTGEKPRSKRSTDDLKPGVLEKALLDQGWFYKAGSVGGSYTYYRPHCKGVDIERLQFGRDYYSNLEAVEMALKASGEYYPLKEKARAPITTTVKASKPQPKKVVRKPKAETKKRKISESEFEDEADCMESEEMVTPEPKERFTKKRKALSNISNVRDDISPDTEKPKTPSILKKPAPSRSIATNFSPDVHDTQPLESTDLNQLLKDVMPRLSTGFIPSAFNYRKQEWSQIETFLRDCFRHTQGASLYLSGAPGSGKSALLSSEMNNIKDMYYNETKDRSDVPTFKSLHVNAVTLKGTSALFQTAAKELTGDTYTSGEKALEALERATDIQSSNASMLLLVIDEIDFLLTHKTWEGDLLRLFELAHRRNHSLLLVGVANQVDFAERHLASLRKQMPQCSPATVVFTPYSFMSIQNILIDRLGGRSAAQRLLDMNGLAFLARKVCSTSGDVRLALDICRRLLSNVNQDKENALKKKGPVVGLSKVISVVKQSLDAGSSHVVESLPRNLKLVLLACTRAMTSGGKDDSARLIPTNALYSTYSENLGSAGVSKRMSSREFAQSLETLASNGLLSYNVKKGDTVKLLFRTSDVLQTLRRDEFIARVM